VLKLKTTNLKFLKPTFIPSVGQLRSIAYSYGNGAGNKLQIQQAPSGQPSLISGPLAPHPPLAWQSFLLKLIMLLKTKRRQQQSRGNDKVAQQGPQISCAVPSNRIPSPGNGQCHFEFISSAINECSTGVPRRWAKRMGFMSGRQMAAKAVRRYF